MSDSGGWSAQGLPGAGGGAQGLALLQSLVQALSSISSNVSHLASVVPPPATSASPGIAGSLAIDSGFLYVCIATNSWKRITLVAF